MEKGDRKRSQRRRYDESRVQSDVVSGFGDKIGPCAEEFRQPLKAKKRETARFSPIACRRNAVLHSF